MMLLIGVIIFLLKHANGNCKWNGLDLSPLSNIDPIQCDYGRFALKYAPCQNTLSCAEDGQETSYGMVMQYESGSDKCVAHTAKWDNGAIQPHMFSNDTMQFVFVYPNGYVGKGCNGGRTTQLTFVCDNDKTVPYVADKTQCEESSQEGGICRYSLEVHSHVACGVVSQAERSLSTGSVLIMIVIIGFIVYCVTGCVINGTKADSRNSTNCKNNTPHYSFWIKVPKLVHAGCLVTFEWIKNKNRSFRKTSYEELQEL
eukprot:177350_1